jgi:hypothetical protein
MADMKDQIAANVREIDNLSRDIAEHWSMVQDSVFKKRIDEAITLLNAYFRLKQKLIQVESSLEATLKGYFSDK